MGRTKECKRVDVGAVHDHRDPYGGARMEIIDAVNQLPRCENGFIHRGCEQARALLCHMDALTHLLRVKVADLRCLADIQIVHTWHTCRTARHGDDRKIRIRLKNDGDLLRLCRIVQMIVEDACIPIHRITVENAALLHILRTVGEEQRAARIAGLHIPAAHHARRTG